MKYTLEINYWSLFKRYYLLLGFLVAFSLRIVLVGVDLPFVFHPDEPTVINSTQNLKYDPNPKHFDWPHFYYYFNFVFYFILESAHKVSFKLGYEDLARQLVDLPSYYLLTRIISTVFGALSCLFLSMTVFNLTKSRKIALISGLLLATTPFHITRSAQALTDVPMLFFLIVSVFFISRFLVSEKKWNLYYSFFFAGLSVSTKYNGYLIFPTLLLTLVWIRAVDIKDWFFYLKLIFLGFLGFFVGTPYFIFDWKTFIRSDSYVGILWQFKNVGKVDFLDQIFFFFQNLFFNLAPDIGYLTYYFSLIFVFYFLFKKKFSFDTVYTKFILILIVQLMYLIWVVSGLEVQRTHYFITLYFIPPILAALFVSRYKILTIIVLSFSFLSAFWVLYTNLSKSIYLQLYQDYSFGSPLNETFVYADSKRIITVLKKLDVDNRKFGNLEQLKTVSKYNYVVTDQNLCTEGIDDCRFRFRQELSDLQGDKVRIYEIKY